MKISENIYSIKVGQLEVNCVIAVCPDTSEAVIFDPGDETEKISGYIEEKGFHPVMILNTHCHYDHIGAVEDLRKKYNIKFYIHEAEKEYSIDPEKNYSVMSDKKISIIPDALFREGEILKFGNKQLKVIHTPGHTLGGCCFLIDNVLISGDTLFAGSVGRTDLYGGDTDTIINSVTKKLLTLPENTLVIPGHDRITSIGQEKLFNPYF